MHQKKVKLEDGAAQWRYKSYTQQHLVRTSYTIFQEIKSIVERSWTLTTSTYIFMTIITSFSKQTNDYRQTNKFFILYPHLSLSLSRENDTDLTGSLAFSVCSHVLQFDSDLCTQLAIQSYFYYYRNDEEL